MFMDNIDIPNINDLIAPADWHNQFYNITNNLNNYISGSNGYGISTLPKMINTVLNEIWHYILEQTQENLDIINSTGHLLTINKTRYDFIARMKYSISRNLSIDMRIQYEHRYIKYFCNTYPGIADEIIATYNQQTLAPDFQYQAI